MMCSRCRGLTDDVLPCTCGHSLCADCRRGHNCRAADRPLWPWQERSLPLIEQALDSGCLALCVTGPTGTGKTRVVTEMCRRQSAAGKRVLLFTNRKIITAQSGRTLEDHGVDFGVLAAGYPTDLGQKVQVARVQTVKARAIDRSRWKLPEADLVLIDEAHSGAFDPVLSAYQHTPKVGFTATPVGLGGKYEQLLVAGTKAEARRHGALVPCDVFGPSEPDMRGVKMNKVGEFVHKGAVKRVMQCTVFSDVLGSWRELNPWGLPTLLYAPGVPESRWFCEQFRENGVSAAHLDGESSDAEREGAIAASRDGSVAVLCSFGIMREGADLPWIRHLILVQVCGALSTYLQIVGRLLRAYPGKDRATLQDHSGSWHRHGSPNADRDWRLGETDKSIAKDMKKARQRCQAPPEPICCPKCHAVRASGLKCHSCGYEHTRSVRMVRTVEGKLKRMVGKVVKTKPTASDPQRLWAGCLYGAARSGRSVAQAAATFRTRAGYGLPRSCKPQPEPGSLDWRIPVASLYPQYAAKKVPS